MKHLKNYFIFESQISKSEVLDLFSNLELDHDISIKCSINDMNVNLHYWSVDITFNSYVDSRFSDDLIMYIKRSLSITDDEMQFDCIEISCKEWKLPNKSQHDNVIYDLDEILNFEERYGGRDNIKSVSVYISRQNSSQN